MAARSATATKSSSGLRSRMSMWLLAPGDRPYAHRRSCGRRRCRYFVAYQQKRSGAISWRRISGRSAAPCRTGRCRIHSRQTARRCRSARAARFHGVRADLTARRTPPAFNCASISGDAAEQVHIGVDVLHQRAHVRHDGRQLPQRNAQVLQDFRGFAMAQVFAFGSCESRTLSATVFRMELNQGMVSAKVPSKSNFQRCRISSNQSVFWPACGGATSRWGEQIVHHCARARRAGHNTGGVGSRGNPGPAASRTRRACHAGSVTMVSMVMVRSVAR